MIRSYTAFTQEIDDIDLGIGEILERLPARDDLQKHTVGIITCFSEAVETGLVKALCEALPFDVVGTTTIASASPHELGEVMVSLMVLTSDECEFVTGITGPISAEDESVIRESYEKTTAGRTEKPALMISFAPLLFNVSSDFIVDCFDAASGGVPNFGTTAVDHHEDYRDSQVIFNGETFRDRYAYILVYGDVKPEFYVGTVSEERVFPEKGAVTASVGNQLQTVNGLPVIDYLLSLGLEKDENGTIPGINTFPIIVDYNDGTAPVARAMFALTPEGYAVCGGRVPLGSTLSIGEFDALEIKQTSELTIGRALERNQDRAILIFSCVGRYFAQGASQFDEIECARDLMQAADARYLFAYSGCEICPVEKNGGQLTNRSHNNTIIMCCL